jgi:hypothetical protein
MQSLTLSSGPGVRLLAALALARSGDVVRAQKLGDALSRDFPLNTLMVLASYNPRRTGTRPSQSEASD